MKLKEPVIITPPPYTNGKGEIINPPAIEFNNLEISYIDSPYRKVLEARINRIPNTFNLFAGDEYTKIGEWTQAQAEEKVLEFLGDQPGKKLRGLFPKTIEEDPNSPGTQLAKMIKSVGIIINDSCSCRRHALEMNEKGNDWCEQNIDTIVGWLRQEAKNRSLPFIDAIGKLMVSRAIKKSRKLLANQPIPENDEDLDKE
jgi:hypothetical protein